MNREPIRVKDIVALASMPARHGTSATAIPDPRWQRNELQPAASRANTAQPALSPPIANLEKELGTPLSDRTSRRVTITPAGIARVQRAHRVLTEFDEASQSARDAVQLLSGRGRAGFVPRFAFETNDMSLTGLLVARGIRIAILPLSDARAIKALVTIVRRRDRRLVYEGVHWLEPRPSVPSSRERSHPTHESRGRSPQTAGRMTCCGTTRRSSRPTYTCPPTIASPLVPSLSRSRSSTGSGSWRGMRPAPR